MKLSVYFIAVVGLLVAGFGLGWMECNWHRDSLDLSALKAQDSAQAKASQQLTDAANTLAGKINTINTATDDGQTQTLNAIKEQGDALSKLSTKLSGLDVGDCRLAPAVDGLYQSAYQAVAPANATPATVHQPPGG